MTQEANFSIIRKWTEDRFSQLTRKMIRCIHVEYMARFWFHSGEADDRGEYRKVKCKDVFMPSPLTGQYRALHTSPNVSYYSQLTKSVGL